MNICNFLFIALGRFTLAAETEAEAETEAQNSI